MAVPWLACAGAIWLALLIWPPSVHPVPLPAGWVTVEGQMGDINRGPFRPWFFLETVEGPVLVEGDLSQMPVPGTTIQISGRSTGNAGIARGIRHRGVLRIDGLTALGHPSLIRRGGEAIRSRVMDRLEPQDRGRALLAGFLIGETSGVADIDQEAMRAAGLSHFTAVSGSNVVLYLGVLYIAAGPLALGPRRRAVVGLLGLPFYAAATGFEPSVMRASVMAALVLAGKYAGLALDSWLVLGVAVGSLLILDPELAHNVGFQLSVAATCGVLVGARWRVDTKWGRSLAVALGAQIAVAPLLVLHFGELPAASPLANLAAAPLVTVATLAASVGVLAAGWLIGPAAWTAERVLDVAHAVAGWPKLDALGFLLVTTLGLVVWRRPRWRGAAAAMASAALALFMVVDRGPPPGSVVVLDVGQGDAILLSGGHGRFALVDGGPDPVTLHRKLRSYGVTSLDLMVATHVHADHVSGLVPVATRMPVGESWVAFDPHSTTRSASLLGQLQSLGVPIVTPAPGVTFELGELVIEVMGPMRRYASPNDQSIVLMVSGRERRMLLPGDIEVVAQADLGDLKADILKVPHQGAATSDPRWLSLVNSSEAVISVGPNNFGHPAPWVVDLLVESGAIVHRTDVDGDVVVDLG